MLIRLMTTFINNVVQESRFSSSGQFRPGIRSGLELDLKRNLTFLKKKTKNIKFITLCEELF
jgi:hypothetical protein